MKVNMVLWKDKHIVPRMAQWLADRNGWTISEEPDNSADVNYYLPYLKWDMKNQPDTLTAAWFTHYEYGTRWKEQHWRQAATFIDTQLITTPIYAAPQFDLDRYQVITPGVDRDIFVPGIKEKTDRPIVGIAGIGQPRKGPKLVVDLYYSGFGVALNIVGANWPFYPYTEIAFDKIPHWYTQLDVYLCTSSIEGIPAPVLEALSCDVKVVIPYGVGICDQLPEMEGIRHYKKSDGKDMLRAMAMAIEDKPSEGALRDVTKDYSVDEWCNSHTNAMEALLDAAIPV